jgi:ubiquinone/menaquinone biosynthesis C-methylase UbiE
MSISIDEVNRSEMSRPSTVTHYSWRDDLSAAELAALNTVSIAAQGKKILDIGVGGGRTVAALKKISLSYLGVDNSAAMVSACQQRFADTHFELMDARAMSSLPNGSVHMAMFSCNGIGMVSHADRLLILSEVFRVLEPGGVFLFSTHNQNSADHDAAFQWPEFELSSNPARSLVRLARFCKQVLVRWTRRRRLGALEIRTPQYSVINDVCHDYGVMLYYISLSEQRRQIESLGYAPHAEAYDLAGALITADSRDSSLMLVARKPGG